MFVRIVLVPLVDSRHPKWYEHALDIARVNDDNVDGIWHPHTGDPLRKGGVGRSGRIQEGFGPPR